MGIHRNVIHPKFGNFILLTTILLGTEVTAHSNPISYNPCLACKLCVSACPVGAIGADGHFNFAACYTHNYREFMGGFSDWVETIAESKDAKGYRSTVTDSESASMWQSLSFGANYKAAYCLAVCPAGEDVIAPSSRIGKDLSKPWSSRCRTRKRRSMWSQVRMPKRTWSVGFLTKSRSSSVMAFGLGPFNNS